MFGNFGINLHFVEEYQSLSLGKGFMHKSGKAEEHIPNILCSTEDANGFRGGDEEWFYKLPP